MAKMKVLHVIASLQGGAAEHVLYLIEGLHNIGVSVHLAAPADVAVIWDKLLKSPYSLLEIPTRENSSTFTILKKYIIEQEFDIVHSHGIRAGVFCRRTLAKVVNRPYSIYTIHGYHPVFYKSGLKRWAVNYFEKRAFRNLTDKVICVSTSDKEEYERVIGKKADHNKVILIPNGIDPNKYDSPLPMDNFSWPYSENDIVIGTIGRLMPQKRIDLLLDAIALVNKKKPQIKLSILGDGPLCGTLKEKSKMLGLEKTVHFHGNQENVGAWLKKWRLFVLSSEWEGLPLVILESWAAGCPVVATEVPGTVDLINSKNDGLLVKFGSPEALAEAILFALENFEETEKWRVCGKKKLLENYHVKDMIKKTHDLYKEVVRK